MSKTFTLAEPSIGGLPGQGDITQVEGGGIPSVHLAAFEGLTVQLSRIGTLIPGTVRNYGSLGDFVAAKSYLEVPLDPTLFTLAQQKGYRVSTLFEHLDPSEKYKGTHLEGTGALYRQFLRFGLETAPGNYPMRASFVSGRIPALDMLFPVWVQRILADVIDDSGYADIRRLVPNQSPITVTSTFPVVQVDVNQPPMEDAISTPRTSGTTYTLTTAAAHSQLLQHRYKLVLDAMLSTTSTVTVDVLKQALRVVAIEEKKRWFQLALTAHLTANAAWAWAGPTVRLVNSLDPSIVAPSVCSRRAIWEMAQIGTFQGMPFELITCNKTTAWTILQAHAATGVSLDSLEGGSRVFGSAITPPGGSPMDLLVVPDASMATNDVMFTSPSFCFVQYLSQMYSIEGSREDFTRYQAFAQNYGFSAGPAMTKACQILRLAVV